ncbi:cytochrome P450 [Amycolatopsis mongoliensis]|uniref:Cytochrome P450 n=1 Tax=Amycolatopsis mongoliensis TaxID=715475 RepID=A0A9Y2JKJ9_9PSEU|nr:cytochrome P450 [Amycolatopsis sp. 4-36]WIX98548.1 cytochrome P450 [Amycolatopsis sp. 4-36]
MSRVLAPTPPRSPLRPVPGDAGLPLLGYTARYMRDPVGLWRERYERYGPVSWFGGFGSRFVALLGPDANEVVLANRDRAFANAEGWRYLIGPFFDRGLMLLDFDEHLAHRRIMQQAFTRERLTGYVEALNPAIADGLRAWRPGAGFRVYPAAKQLTLDLATDIFMGGAEGTARSEMDRINRAFVDCVQAATAIVRAPVPGGRWRKGLAGRERLDRFLRSYLPARRGGDGDDLYSVLCHLTDDDGARFSDDDVIDHMVFLLMAAHDTSTITISTMMSYLGQHPLWRERCREESLALGKEFAEHSDLDGLEALDLVMKESLRLVTPVPTMARITVKDTEVLGHYVPQGTKAVVTPIFSHRMPEYWPEPDRFDPGRFAPERREDKVHRYAWQPFGGGVHKCLGMHFSAVEVKAVLHQLLLRFDWTVPAGYRAPMNYTSLPYPADGHPVHLVSR